MSPPAGIRSTKKAIALRTVPIFRSVHRAIHRATRGTTVSIISITALVSSADLKGASRVVQFFELIVNVSPVRKFGLLMNLAELTTTYE
jgi:hypothetical protein